MAKNKINLMELNSNIEKINKFRQIPNMMVNGLKVVILSKEKANSFLKTGNIMKVGFMWELFVFNIAILYDINDIQVKAIKNEVYILPM